MSSVQSFLSKVYIQEKSTFAVLGQMFPPQDIFEFIKMTHRHEYGIFVSSEIPHAQLRSFLGYSNIHTDANMALL